MIHLYIAYYNQPRPALQSTFGTKNRLLPYQPHCELHSVRKTVSCTNRTANRIPYEKTPPAVPNAPQTAFRTKNRLLPYQPRPVPHLVEFHTQHILHNTLAS